MEISLKLSTIFLRQTFISVLVLGRRQVQQGLGNKYKHKTHSVHSLHPSFKEQLCTPAGSVKGDNPEGLFGLFLVIAQNNYLMLCAWLVTNITVYIVKELPAKTGFSDRVSLCFAVVMERKLPLKLLKCDPAVWRRQSNEKPRKT